MRSGEISALMVVEATSSGSPVNPKLNAVVVPDDGVLGEARTADSAREAPLDLPRSAGDDQGLDRRSARSIIARMGRPVCVEV